MITSNPISFAQNSKSLFKQKLEMLSNQGGRCLIVKDDKTLSSAYFLEALLQKLKGTCGFTDWTNQRLIEFKIIEFLTEGQQWVESSEDKKMVRSLAKRVGLVTTTAGGSLELTPDDSKNHSELGDLVTNIYNKTLSPPVDKKQENRESPLERFYFKYKQELAPFLLSTSNFQTTSAPRAPPLRQQARTLKQIGRITARSLKTNVAKPSILSAVAKVSALAVLTLAFLAASSYDWQSSSPSTPVIITNTKNQSYDVSQPKTPNKEIVPSPEDLNRLIEKLDPFLTDIIKKIDLNYSCNIGNHSLTFSDENQDTDLNGLNRIGKEDTYFREVIAPLAEELVERLVELVGKLLVIPNKHLKRLSSNSEINLTFVRDEIREAPVRNTVRSKEDFNRFLKDLKLFIINIKEGLQTSFFAFKEDLKLFNDVKKNATAHKIEVNPTAALQVLPQFHGY